MASDETGHFVKAAAAATATSVNFIRFIHMWRVGVPGNCYPSAHGDGDDTGASNQAGQHQRQ